LFLKITSVRNPLASSCPTPPPPVCPSTAGVLGELRKNNKKTKVVMLLSYPARKEKNKIK
jgi:hypothetical protein